jgi:beta-N-acetylhexosaminidase
MLAVMSRPADLTPADTSSLVSPGLADALRRHHRAVTELVVDRDPQPSDVSAVVASARDHEVVIVGTINASAGQAELVSAVIRTGRPVITLALRDPFDLRHYPEADVHLASYSIHRESLDAAADVVFGIRSAPGVLPVGIPGVEIKART